MSHELLKEGGPHKIKKTGSDVYSMQISIPPDGDGRTSRECPNEECSPGYFKIKGGTGKTEHQEVMFCPYCRYKSEPNSFTTEEQKRYAKDLLINEVQDGIENMITDALGLDSSGKKKYGGDFVSMEMSFKPGSKPVVMRPFEEDVRRDVICSYCGLDQSVYGLAVWCSDCGKDIFLDHVKAEFEVTRSMLSDIERRRNLFGSRVAAKDLENCLEDTVSIFEAVLKALVKRYLNTIGKSQEEIISQFNKIGNAFQNVQRSIDIFTNDLGLPLFNEPSSERIGKLSGIFEKRHPITHNLGVIDKKYINKARIAAEEGKEILVSKEEIEQAIEHSFHLFRSLHERLFEKPLE